MRGAIIGYGNIAEKGHLPAYRKLGVSIVAIADVCPKRQKIASKAGLKSYSSPEELIENEDIDFLDLCTPPNCRLEALRLASSAGIDVLCEKPIARAWEADEIRKILMKSDIFFFPVHNWKYSPHYRKMKELMDGRGDILVQTQRITYSMGNEDWNPNWRVDRTISGGGILMDHGYHNIYLAMYLMGTEFERARLRSISFYDNRGVDNAVGFELEFPKDRRAVINLTWISDRREVKVTYNGSRRIELLENRMTAGNKVFEFDHSLSHDSIHTEWYQSVISDFLSNRLTGDKKYLTEALKVLEGIRELYKQSEKKGMVNSLRGQCGSQD